MVSTHMVILGAGALAILILITTVVALHRKATHLKDALARTEEERSNLAHKLKPVLDVEAEAEKLRAASEKARGEVEEERARIKAESAQLGERYAQALKTYELLDGQVKKLEENLEDISYGLYKPHFSYDDSEAYKGALQSIRERQALMVRTGQATTCNVSWAVGGNRREGEKMVKQCMKLILRAFNAESDAAIANVAWNNYRVMRERIDSAFDALNKLGTVLQVALASQYKEARTQKLQLVFEAAEKRKKEREEQRRIRAEEREEERVQLELQREQEEAQKDEARFEKALARARRDMETVRDTEREAMSTRIRELESDLAAARDRKERAIAQAQLTKVGHVYVISNIGAFGEGVLKIGLTRRLDPEDRVHELGDASVPFPFDIHTLIYSENAPELERKLHDRFWENRLNWSNDRKEFFRVDVNEVEAALRHWDISTELSSVPEAREYRETLTAIQASKQQVELPGVASRSSAFPADPFATPGPQVGASGNRNEQAGGLSLPKTPSAPGEVKGASSK